MVTCPQAPHVYLKEALETDQVKEEEIPIFHNVI